MPGGCPGVRVVPEWLGGGTPPRKDLHEAAQEWTTGQAGLIAVGEPTIEKAVDQAPKRRRGGEATVDATATRSSARFRKPSRVRDHGLVQLGTGADVERAEHGYNRQGCCAPRPPRGASP
jgi:hypothetical protein